MKKIVLNWRKCVVRVAMAVALVLSLSGVATSITLIEAIKNDLNLDQTTGVLPIKGDPDNPQHGDWYFHIFGEDQLGSSRYETGAWELKGTMGGNGNVAVAGSFMLMTRDGKYAYRNNSGNVRTMMYPANTDPDGVTVGNTSGRLFLLSSGATQAVHPNPESSFTDLIYYDDVDEKTNTVFEFDFPITTDNRGIESLTFDIQSSPPEGTKARFQVFNDVGDLVYENTDAFHCATDGLVCVQGDNLVELDELFAVAAGVVFPSVWTFSNSVTLRGQGTGVDFKPYIKFSQIQLQVHDVVAIPSWLNMYRKQAGSFTEGDWIYEEHTIYKCNTTGVQSTDFASNLELWDRLDDYPNPDVMVYKGGITVEDFNDLTSGTVGDVYRIIAGGTESELVGGETALVGSTVTVKQDFSTTVTGTDYDYFAPEIDESLVIDGDGDTHIKVEATTDDDTIRFTTAAGERMIIKSGGKVGIGTSAPVAIAEFVGSPAGNIGGFQSGIIHVRNSDTAINSNAVITGHNSNNGNRQLWYLGSGSSGNDNIGFINRRAGNTMLSNPSGSLTVQEDGDTAVTGNLLAAGGISVTGNLLVSTNGTDIFGVAGDRMSYDDETRNRINVDTSETKLTSPDGTKSISVTNNGVETVGRQLAEFHLTSTIPALVLNDDGVTWTKIHSMVGNLLQGFTVSGGTLTKTAGAAIFLVNGVSDLEVNKACSITYGLAINGSVIPHETTLHTFSVQSKMSNISITALAEISENDTIEIWCKGDGTAGIEVCIPKLDVTFFGE
jgi:hypothetical protein